MHKTLDLQNKNRNRNGINNKLSFSLVPKNFKVLFALSHKTCRCHYLIYLTYEDIMKHQNINPASLIAGMKGYLVTKSKK